MNIFELLSVVLWFGGAVAGGVWGRSHFGVLGAAAGFVIVGAALPLLLIGSGRFVGFWIPEMPPCICGGKWPGDYRSEGLHDLEGERFVSIYLCARCGRRYAKGVRRVDELAPDGTRVPYMMHTPFGRWRRVLSVDRYDRRTE